jgi:AcrR family transcriptional regulator
MPKIISDHERELTRNALIEQTKKLIRLRGGIKHISVDDIVRAVGMGKGSFYSYFKTKEECLCEVIQNTWTERVSQAKMISQENLPTKEFAARFVHDIMLADDVGKYINPTDVDMVLRKLPAENHERALQVLRETDEELMVFLKLDQVQAEAVHLFVACIEFTATEESSSDQAKQEVINALAEAMAEYVDKNKKT